MIQATSTKIIYSYVYIDLGLRLHELIKLGSKLKTTTKSEPKRLEPWLRDPRLN